ncbi:DUF5008 domain-containing protein [Mucilaginibacter celer]|uniref:DUF5008 domain-containing protein n=2 Tax=Mucilaginibacter celer TaxID=2305508 RepID=A0A494VGW7_9SPHI|nr:DUF5008 domain-containing protein [Mucilaginibacter celer]
MQRMIQDPTKTYTLLLMLLLVLIGGCKKDKNEHPVLVFKVVNYFPNSGNTGTLITIEGSGFDNDLSKYTATVVGKQAEVVSATANYVVVMVPAGSGTGKIELKYAGNVHDIGTYTYQALSVKAISPNRGPVGTNIRIRGEGFSDPDKPAVVTINGNPANIVSLSDTLIIATVPDKTLSGPVEVKVKESSSKGPNFRVQALFDITPKTGGKGTKVTLIGSGFETEVAKNQVTFNGKAAQILEATETKLLVQAPDGVQTGRVNLKIEDTPIEGPVFTVIAPPTISLITPLSGPAGTEVTITGTGFSTIAGETKVAINGKDAVIKSVTATELKVTVPVNTGTGNIQVSVNDQVVAGPVYTEQAVGISGFSPDNGNVGTVVTITGVGFSTTPANNTVTFNGVVAKVNAATATQLVVVAPQGVSTGFIKVRVNGVEAVSPKVFQTSGVITITTGLPHTSVNAFCAGQHGEFYVLFRTYNQVYKVDPNGTVTLYAGDPNGRTGNNEGIGTLGRFTAPVGIVMDKQGNLFVAEASGNIKKIAPNGMVTMYVASASIGASGLAIDNQDRLYIGARSGSFFGFVIVTNGVPNYSFDLYADPEGRMAIDGVGKVYGSDLDATGRYAIGDGSYERLIGDYSAGYADGSYSDARFGTIGNMIWADTKKLVLVCDPENNALRAINPATQKVTTIFKTQKGFKDGGLADALFGDITDVTIAPNGDIFILDKTNKAIRKVTF